MYLIDQYTVNPIQVNIYLRSLSPFLQLIQLKTMIREREWFEQEEANMVKKFAARQQQFISDTNRSQDLYRIAGINKSQIMFFFGICLSCLQ